MPRLAVLVLLVASTAAATTYTVPDDFATIQAALDAAQAGDTVQVRQAGSPYADKLVFPRSGDAVNGSISLQAVPGDVPVIDGTGVAGQNLVLIENRTDVRLVGFELRNNRGVDDGSGVRVLGAGTHIEIRDNRIHDVRGRDAMGITVYGTAAASISDLVLDHNEIQDCEPYRSEALTLDGNVTGFAVTNTVVRDVNNIGIHCMGGETDVQPDPAIAVRNGGCRGNVVLRANEQGGGYAAGIYVDGGRDIVIEHNVVSGSDLGIEVGAETPGLVTSGIVGRDNVVRGNDKVGIVFDGQFVWQGTAHAGFAAYRAGSGQDVASLFDVPLLIDPAGDDFHLAAGSPAVDAGDPLFVAAPGETDLDGAPRLSGATADIGADELTCGNGSVEPGEACDDGNGLDGDGCDGNCTATGCGNGIVSAGEQCDDGNLVGGDCCAAGCLFEAAGSACDDGEACSNADACDGAGGCAGARATLPSCNGTASGRSSLVLKDAGSDAGGVRRPSRRRRVPPVCVRRRRGVAAAAGGGAAGRV